MIDGGVTSGDDRPIVIRPARPDDDLPLAELHVRSWQVAYEHIFGSERLAEMSIETGVGRWQTILAEGGQTTLVAELDGRVAGVCTVGKDRGGGACGELWGLYVMPEAWGTGVAQALMRAGLENLRDAGYGEAVLWVLDDNPRARRFYAREGWTVDSVERQGRHLDVTTRERRYHISLAE